MKLLLFSDVHCDVESIARLVAQSGTADAVVGAGDFGSVRRGLNEVVRALAAIECPAVLVAGNAESADELREAAGACWPSAVVLHGSGTNIEDVAFFGLGGAVPVTPFGSWSYDLTEEEAEAALAPCPPNAVLVTHAPPFGAVDRSSSGRRLGSRAIRATIERTQPRLAVCGHIHDSAGETDYIGGTPVINAGPRGIEWTLDPVDDEAAEGATG